MNNQVESNKDRKNESGSWALGIALILIGGLFLLDNLNLVNINLTNWWAIFILIPGLNMTVNGWKHYQMNQSHSSRSTAFWGMLLIILSITLFFNISWSLIFPLGLIVAGLYIFFFR